MNEFINVTQQLFKGFGENCFIFSITLLLALPLGLIVSMGSMSKFKPLKWLTKAFVWVIRGTPLMLQLFVVFYIPPLVSNGSFNFPRMQAALIAFVISFLFITSASPDMKSGIQLSKSVSGPTSGTECYC